MYKYFTIEELRQCGFYRMEGEKNPYVWYFNGTPYGLNNPIDLHAVREIIENIKTKGNLYIFPKENNNII